LFAALSRAGGKAFSNMAVGYNNVDVSAANKYGVAVGNVKVIQIKHKRRLEFSIICLL
jgi:lactate dehydrogenase-like 2-hydroxyacid dehydrogenase